jgi:hypothetical protein
MARSRENFTFTRRNSVSKSWGIAPLIHNLCTRCDWSAAGPGFFETDVRDRGTLWKEGGMGFRFGPDAVEKS